MNKLVSLTLASVIGASLMGCSYNPLEPEHKSQFSSSQPRFSKLFNRDSNTITNGILETDKQLFDALRAEEIIRNVEKYSHRRSARALKDSPSEYSALSSLLREYEAGREWSPVLNRLQVLEHYKEGVNISDAVPEKSETIVRMNDDVIVVVIPNSWAWNGYNELTVEAQKDLDAVASVLADSRSTSVIKAVAPNSSYNTRSIFSGKTRAEIVRNYILVKGGRDPKDFVAERTKTVFSMDNAYSDSIVIVVHHDYELNSQEYWPENQP